MAKSNGITSLKQAAKLLNKHSPDGESLAYINPEEARVLRARGGSGIMTVAGVPSYDEVPWYKKVWNFVTGRYQDQPEVWNQAGTKVIERAQSGVGNLITDAIATYGFLRAKKDAAGLDEAEMAEFNRLNAQLTASQEQFTEYTGGGEQLKAPEYVTTPKAVARDIDFSGETTPELITTPRAQGGRIGAFNGGIQGLMPQQGMPQQGFMPQQGLDPRMGYALGDEVEQITEKITETPENMQMADLDDIPDWYLMDFEKLLEDFRIDNNGNNPSSINELEKWYRFKRTTVAQGGRIGYADGTEFVDKIYSDEARTLAGNIPEVRKSDSQYYPTLFEEREKGEWKYPGEPRPGQEYLTSTLQGANTILDEMEMQKLRLTELAAEQGLDFNNLFERELNRITETEGPATQDITRIKDKQRILKKMEFKLKENLYAQGGRIGAQGGGIMPLLDMGGMEKDYRQDGGFVPIGRREKGDDVPARLSKNEFVFTADAVKAAGGGDIDQGAQRMYNVMKNLEAGGEISQQSQGKA